MAVITAPTPPPANFYAAKNIRGNNGAQVEIFGYVIPNAGNMTNGLTVPYSFPTQTTLFDVSVLTENHEVIVGGYVSPNSISGSVTYTANWVRVRDSMTVFSISLSLAAPTPPATSYGPGTSVAFWIGWLSDLNSGVGGTYKEIQENGKYYVTVSASGGENFSQQIDFVVKGIPPNIYFPYTYTTSFDWIVRVSEFFDTTNYIRAGICTQPFTQGQSAAPNGILASNDAFAATDACSTQGTIAQSPSLYYTYYGFVQAANGLYYQAGSYSPTTGRPVAWAWYTAKTSGQKFALTSAEWNDFTTRINQVEAYKAKPTTSFTTAPYGDGTFQAFMFNQAANAIAAMSPPTPAAANQTSGNIVYASLLNTGLRDSLNSIP